MQVVKEEKEGTCNNGNRLLGGVGNSKRIGGRHKVYDHSFDLLDAVNARRRKQASSPLVKSVVEDGSELIFVVLSLDHR